MFGICVQLRITSTIHAFSDADCYQFCCNQMHLPFILLIHSHSGFGCVGCVLSLLVDQNWKQNLCVLVVEWLYRLTTWVYFSLTIARFMICTYEIGRRNVRVNNKKKKWGLIDLTSQLIVCVCLCLSAFSFRNENANM